MVVIALASLLGAARWDQRVVGSKTLLRPFGYFGSVLGISLALAVVWAIGWPHAGVSTIGDLGGVRDIGDVGSVGVISDGVNSIHTSRGLGVTGLALLAAAAAVAAPWVQAIGRLRCLVQGCCHGAPSGAIAVAVAR